MIKKNAILPLVLMAAGRSNRMGVLTYAQPKPLLIFFDKPLLEYFLERAIDAGVKNLIIIVGYRAEQIKKFVKTTFKSKLNVTFIDNDQYDTTNNLYSLYLARKILKGRSFLLCNADIMVNKKIIIDLIKNDENSTIAVDIVQKRKKIDSPGVLIKDNKIYDLGRHISRFQNDGYAIGIYKFNAELSNAFFKKAEIMLRNNIKTAFHDPLLELFKDYSVYAYDTHELSWTDVDRPEEISKMKKTIQKIIKEERKK